MSIKHLLASSALALTTALTMSACKDTGEKAAKVAPVTTPILGTFGIDIEAMDTSVKPGDDFFKYVNGGWLERTEIPADKSNYGSFSVLGDNAQARVRTIIEDVSKLKSKAGSSEQKIGDLYAAFMDVDAINAAGMAPIADDLAMIAGLDSHDAIAAAMGDPAQSLTAPFGGYVYIDRMDPTKHITYFGQGGLGMPDRDYYLNDDEKTLAMRAAYKTLVTAMLDAAGRKDASAGADRVMAFEKQLAEVQWSRTKRRNRDITYNKMSIEEFKAYAPGVNWGAMMKTAGLGAITEIVLTADEPVQKSAAIFAKTDVQTLQDYMTFHYVSDMAAYLPETVDAANFAFYGKAFRGTEEQRPRWKRGVGQVSGVLGEAIGEVYVKRHFPESSKAQMSALVENLRSSFKTGIDNLEWMGPETKVEAQAKLAAFNPKIGYPDKWTDYSTLSVDRKDLIGTVKSAGVWQWEDMVSDLGKPIDRDEWGMTPQTVNAYYNPSLNEIVFPAAILDAPFFDPNADMAVNYGGIGAVIGHEMGHGFDDQGRKTDGTGEQRDWWTEADAAAFKKRTDALVAQYNAFEPLPGVHVNGELTLGENIGDLTGITMAYDAYHKALGSKTAPVIDGLTGDQRFFLSYGQIWQRKFRDAALEARVKTDPHSPGEYRANGIVRNFDAWYEAFDVQPGDALYLAPEKRVKIW
ncbi:MAG: M13 family metallopeptidase [Robiginitomaculum sp.]